MLSYLKINELNELQRAALEAGQQDQDLVLLSDTGSGKTLGFLLPVLALMDDSVAGTQALVIVPSRELAIQIEQVFRTMGTGYKVTCCYGGHYRLPDFDKETDPHLGDHSRGDPCIRRIGDGDDTGLSLR